MWGSDHFWTCSIFRDTCRRNQQRSEDNGSRSGLVLNRRQTFWRVGLRCWCHRVLRYACNSWKKSFRGVITKIYAMLCVLELFPFTWVLFWLRPSLEENHFPSIWTWDQKKYRELPEFAHQDPRETISLTFLSFELSSATFSSAIAALVSTSNRLFRCSSTSRFSLNTCQCRVNKSILN